MTTRNDVKVHYTHKGLSIPEGSMRQQLAAYEKLPAEVRLALQNAAYDHSPYQLLRAAEIRGWNASEMVARVNLADERKRDALTRTGLRLAA